jgi:hypothetical protein
MNRPVVDPSHASEDEDLAERIGRALIANSGSLSDPLASGSQRPDFVASGAT